MAKHNGNSTPEGEDEGRAVRNSSNFDDACGNDDMDYSQLYNALEEISSYLDDLEERNQALHRELSTLLESNREIRRELQNAAA